MGTTYVEAALANGAVAAVVSHALAGAGGVR